MPEELCQVSPKSHYVSLALHSDPSPYNDYVLKAVFSDAHSEVRSFESGNTRKR